MNDQLNATTAPSSDVDTRNPMKPANPKQFRATEILHDVKAMEPSSLDLACSLSQAECQKPREADPDRSAEPWGAGSKRKAELSSMISNDFDTQRRKLNASAQVLKPDASSEKSTRWVPRCASLDTQIYDLEECDESVEEIRKAFRKFMLEYMSQQK